jgi:hypothetical protein
LNIKFGQPLAWRWQRYLPSATITPPVNVPTPPPCKGFSFEGNMSDDQRRDDLENLFQKFDRVYARMQKVLRGIEYAEKSHEIEEVLDLILESCNISRPLKKDTNG